MYYKSFFVNPGLPSWAASAVASQRRIIMRLYHPTRILPNFADAHSAHVCRAHPAHALLLLQCLHILRNLPPVVGVDLRTMGPHQVLSICDHVEDMSFGDILQRI